MGAKISAIIPTYNRSPFSARDKRNPLYISTYALYEQTVPPVEVIIMDDCSTDNTSDVVKILQKSYPVNYMRMEKRIGNTFSRMKGVENAVNPFLLFLDDDSFPISRDALKCLYSELEMNNLDAVVPPIHFRSTRFDRVTSGENIGKLDGYNIYSNFDKKPHPYKEIIEISNLPGIFLAKKEIIKPQYFVNFSWPNNWGNESFLAWNLIKDERKLGYLARTDAAFIHLKFGWHIENAPELDEQIETLPEGVSVRDVLIQSNIEKQTTGYRDGVTVDDWFRYRIAFSTFMHLLRGNKIENFGDGIEPFVRSNEFYDYGRPPDDRIPDIIAEGMEIGKREYKRFLEKEE